VSILNPLADLVAWAIMHIHAGLGALFGPDTGLAWGLSIAVLVIIIRLLLVPLFVKQVHAQRKMAQHAPHLAELRKKYKNDKARLNEETMKFYKENGVNPLAGCLPMIPQMIVFFSLFYVLRAIADWTPKVTHPSYGLTTAVMESAQQAKIFGVGLGDKLLFSHQAVPLHVAIVIVLTVIVSATTTFMTVRQSAKRGLMQTNVDPDNPMAGMQKYMMYIVPFFSLTGLYWQYGLVLYWVTTNLWTLGQQFFMFRNWTTEDAQAASATAAASGGAARATTQSTARPASGAAKPAAGSGSGAAKSATSSAKTTTNGARSASSAKTGTSSAKPATNGARNSSAAKPAAGARAGANGRTSTSRPASATAGAGAARPRTGSARGDAAAAAPNGQNAGAKRGLLRLGRQKPEPVAEPEVPATKVVRQQPSRQARSKRSGKR
jgi:YidC/Oxa1 family membrane protein insertase